MHKILVDYLTYELVDRNSLYEALCANNTQDATLDSDGYQVSAHSGLDVPNTWRRIISDPSQYPAWAQSGWLKPDGSVTEINYRINSSGFRGAHFTSDPALVFFGCSFTFGIGMHEEKIWPTKTSKHFNLQCCNLGIPGHGLDYYSLYTALWLLKEIPQPRAFLIKFPHQPRITFYRETNDKLYIDNVVCHINKPNVPTSRLSCVTAASALHTSRINTFIALNSITSLAEKLSIPVIVIKDNHFTHINTNADSVARDYYHPGASYHAALSAEAIRKLEQVL